MKTTLQYQIRFNGHCFKLTPNDIEKGKLGLALEKAIETWTRTAPIEAETVYYDAIASKLNESHAVVDDIARTALDLIGRRQYACFSDAQSLDFFTLPFLRYEPPIIYVELPIYHGHSRIVNVLLPWSRYELHTKHFIYKWSLHDPKCNYLELVDDNKVSAVINILSDWESNRNNETMDYIIPFDTNNSIDNGGSIGRLERYRLPSNASGIKQLLSNSLFTSIIRGPMNWNLEFK